MLLFCISSISLLKVTTKKSSTEWSRGRGLEDERCEGCYEFICLQFPKNIVLSSRFLKCKTAAPGPRTTSGHLPGPGSPVLLCLTLVAFLLPRQLRKDRFFWHFLLLAYSEALILWEEISTQNLSVSDLVVRRPCVLSRWPCFKAHSHDWELRTRSIEKGGEGAKGRPPSLLGSFLFICKAITLYLQEKVSWVRF